MVSLLGKTFDTIIYQTELIPAVYKLEIKMIIHTEFEAVYSVSITLTVLIIEMQSHIILDIETWLF